jgi:hypothetical protein
MYNELMNTTTREDTNRVKNEIFAELGKLKDSKILKSFIRTGLTMLRTF